MKQKPRTTAHLAADAEVKQRQTAHRPEDARQPSPVPRGRAGLKPRTNRDRDRARDVARRPKKYFAARVTVETPELARTPPQRRPTARAGRAPVIGRDVRLRDVMVKDVVVVGSSTTLLDVARRMRDTNVGMLPVVDGGQLRGIVTDRDLVVRAMASGMEPGATLVSSLVSTDVIAGGPDWTLDQAIAAMTTAQIGRLPVTDDRGAVLGVVTLSSLVLRSRQQEDVLEAAKAVSRRSARSAATG